MSWPPAPPGKDEWLPPMDDDRIVECLAHPDRYPPPATLGEILDSLRERGSFVFCTTPNQQPLGDDFLRSLCGVAVAPFTPKKKSKPPFPPLKITGDERYWHGNSKAEPRKRHPSVFVWNIDSNPLHSIRRRAAVDTSRLATTIFHEFYFADPKRIAAAEKRTANKKAKREATERAAQGSPTASSSTDAKRQRLDPDPLPPLHTAPPDAVRSITPALTFTILAHHARVHVPHGQDQADQLAETPYNEYLPSVVSPAAGEGPLRLRLQLPCPYIPRRFRPTVPTVAPGPFPCGRGDFRRKALAVRRLASPHP